MESSTENVSVHTVSTTPWNLCHALTFNSATFGNALGATTKWLWRPQRWHVESTSSFLTQHSTCGSCSHEQWQLAKCSSTNQMKLCPPPPPTSDNLDEPTLTTSISISCRIWYLMVSSKSMSPNVTIHPFTRWDRMFRPDGSLDYMNGRLD